MKALISEDIIIKVCESGNVEIGSMPKGIGLDRLRWDGNKIIDLSNLNEFWIRNNGGIFELHCIPVKDSQLVEMSYADRKNLVLNGNSIRIKSSLEIDNERIARLKFEAKNRLKEKLGDITNLNMELLAFICAIIVYIRQQPAQLELFFDSIIPDIKDIFPMSRWDTVLKNFSKDLKQFMNEYYNEVDNI